MRVRGIIGKAFQARVGFEMAALPNFGLGLHKRMALPGRVRVGFPICHCREWGSPSVASVQAGRVPWI